MTRPFRFGVQSYTAIEPAGLARPGTTCRGHRLQHVQRRRPCDRTRSGAVARPIIRCRTSRRSRRWPWRSKRRARSASARGCSASTTANRSCSRRRWRRSTSSPRVVSNSASAPDGSRASTRRWACLGSCRRTPRSDRGDRSPCSGRISATASSTIDGDHVHASGFEGVPKPPDRRAADHDRRRSPSACSGSPAARPTSSASTSTTARARSDPPASGAAPPN